MAEYTAKQIIETPFAAFDKREEFDRDIAPLIGALVDACQALDLPIIVGVCTMQAADGDNNINLSRCLPNPETVPAELIAAESVARGDLQHAVQTMNIDSLRLAFLRQASSGPTTH